MYMRDFTILYEMEINVFLMYMVLLLYMVLLFLFPVVQNMLEHGESHIQYNNFSADYS